MVVLYIVQTLLYISANFRIVLVMEPEPEPSLTSELMQTLSKYSEPCSQPSSSLSITTRCVNKRGRYYLNLVGKNKKVHDFSFKLGVTHWGVTFFVIKKF